LRCEEARRLLLAGADDVQATRHLEGCAACFEALEAGDPLVPALIAARPPDTPAPAGLAPAVLTRWSAGRARPLTAFGGALTAGLAAAAVLAAIVIEALVGAEPARLAALWALAGALLAVVESALVALSAIRSILYELPGVLSAFTVLTLAVCALWLRLVLSGVPTWRSAR
jgi:hypothetical protein